MTAEPESPRRWRGRPVSVPDGFVREALEVRRQMQAAATTAERQALPTAEALATKWGVSFATARRYLTGVLPKRMSHDA